MVEKLFMINLQTVQEAWLIAYIFPSCYIKICVINKNENIKAWVFIEIIHNKYKFLMADGLY